MTELIEPQKITKQGKRFYTDEQKRQIIDSAHREGISMSKLARRYNMHRQLLSRWNLQLANPVPRYHNKPYRDFKKRVPFTHTAKPNITFARVHLVENDVDIEQSNQDRPIAKRPEPRPIQTSHRAPASMKPSFSNAPTLPPAVAIHVTFAIEDKLPICLPVNLDESNKSLILKALEQI